jgi:transposase
MVVAREDFPTWLAQAEIPQQRLTPEVQALLQAVFRFRQEQGFDYFSTRLLSHFLLHCHSGLKVAQLARLLGISRPTASEQQRLSSKQVIQQAHHRLDGRPYGKLLPRFAGPIAGFLLGHPEASRADLLDFIQRNFGVAVSRIAVYKFLKKYGLDHLAQPQQRKSAPGAPPVLPPPASPAPAQTGPPQPPGQAAEALALPPLALPTEASGQIHLPSPSLIPVLAPAPPFSSGGPNTPAPSC